MTILSSSQKKKRWMCARLCMQHRAESVVPHRMDEMIDVIRRKDFPAFAELTMKDSNQFHASCLDTYPPIFYLSSVSQQVIHLVHRYNRHYGETRVRESWWLLFIYFSTNTCCIYTHSAVTLLTATLAN